MVVDDMEKIAEKLMKFDNCVVKFTPIATLGVKEEEATEEQKQLIVSAKEFKLFHKNSFKSKTGRIEGSREKL